MQISPYNDLQKWQDHLHFDYNVNLYIQVKLVNRPFNGGNSDCGANNDDNNNIDDNENNNDNENYDKSVDDNKNHSNDDKPKLIINRTKLN